MPTYLPAIGPIDAKVALPVKEPYVENAKHTDKDIYMRNWSIA